jgi:GST-like protein
VAPYLAGGQYTIADMICYPWCVNWKLQGQNLDDFKHMKRWFEELGTRPAVQRGMKVGADLSVDVTKLPAEEQARIRKIMYNQRARPVKGE